MDYPFEEYIKKNGWVTNDKGDYSSLGTLRKKYTKDNDIDIYFGLNERGLPPTLTYPRPHYVVNDHGMNRILENNTPEEVLKMIKNNGGVVQTVALADYINIDKVESNNEASKPIYEQVAKELDVPYLSMAEISKLQGDALHTAYENYDKIMKKAAPLKTEINKQFPLVNVRDFVDHIDYMVKLIGVDHVGISSDFDGGGGIQAWDNAAETFNITYELVKRGYTENDIAKIWGLNLLRVLDEVDAVAKELKGM